jgi:hypothetical protein
MTASGRTRRRRLFVAAAALLVGTVALLAREHDARAQQNLELTMMFHGSVVGKIAPCG